MPVNRDSSVPINFNPRRFTRLRMDGLNKTRSVDLFKIVQNFHNQAVRIELPVPDCPGIKLYLNWHTMDPALLEIGIEDHGKIGRASCRERMEDSEGDGQEKAES